MTNGGGSPSSSDTEASSSDPEPNDDGDEGRTSGSSAYVVDVVDRESTDAGTRTRADLACPCTGDTASRSTGSANATRVRLPASRRPDRGLTSGAAESRCRAYADGFGVVGSRVVWPCGGGGGIAGMRVGVVDPALGRRGRLTRALLIPTSDPSLRPILVPAPLLSTLVVLALTIPTRLGASPLGDPFTSDAAVRTDGRVGGVDGSTTFLVRALNAGCGAGEGMCIFPVTYERVSEV
jgi:hypothetical protein